MMSSIAPCWTPYIVQQPTFSYRALRPALPRAPLLARTRPRVLFVADAAQLLKTTFEPTQNPIRYFEEVTGNQIPIARSRLTQSCEL
jgi:hypothetical protein